MLDYAQLAGILRAFLENHSKCLGRVESSIQYCCDHLAGYTPLDEYQIIITDTPSKYKGLEKENRNFTCVLPDDIGDYLDNILYATTEDIYFVVRVYPEYARNKVYLEERPPNNYNHHHIYGSERIYFRLFTLKKED